MTTMVKVRPDFDDGPVKEMIKDTKPGPSWHVEATDDSGKVWSSGVRLATKDEAMRYMASAVNAFRDAGSPIVAMRTVQSSDAPIMWYSRYTSGPRKGRFGWGLNFPHGTCGLFGWNEVKLAAGSN